MSAIFGIIQRDGSPVKPNLHEKMFESLANWGGLRSGSWRSVDESVVMGHFLSEETPESIFERQPIERNGIVFVGDVRLDNREELIAALELRFLDEVEMIPDGELIFRAWERWGRLCVDRLVGAFAFVVWDIERREAFCARDHIGLRPFYFFEAADRFVFATDLRAILDAGVGNSEALDEDYLLLMFMLLFDTEMRGRTPFRDIARLSPGHTLLLKMERDLISQKYWPRNRYSNINPGTAEEMAELLGEKMRTAIVSSLRTSSNVAVHVSGGLDSSALAAMAVSLSKKPIQHSFSWSPPFSSHPRVDEDERDRVEMICKRLDLECHFTSVDPQLYNEIVQERDFCREPRFVWMHEIEVCRKAKELGIGALLSGWGGDECVTLPAGPIIYWELLTRGRWIRLFHESAAWTKRNGGALLPNLVRLSLINPLRKRWRYFQGDVPRAEPVERRLKLLSPSERETFLRYEEVEFLGRSNIREEMLYRLERGNITSRLESWAQLEARERGPSHRYPLLDRRVLDFMLALDARWQHHMALDRFPLTYLCRDLLPPELTMGKKPPEPAILGAMSSPNFLRENDFMDRNPLIDRWIHRLSEEWKQVDNGAE